MDGIKSKLVEQGKSDQEAGREAWRQVWKDRVAGAWKFALFGEIINIIWEFGSLGLLGWTGGDDDEEKKDVLLNTILFSPVQGTPFLGNFAKAISGGHEYQPMMLWDELSDSYDGLKYAVQADGWFSQSRNL